LTETRRAVWFRMALRLPLQNAILMSDLDANGFAISGSLGQNVRLDESGTHLEALADGEPIGRVRLENMPEEVEP